MRQKIARTLVLAMVLTALLGCGGGGGSTSDPTPTPSPTPRPSGGIDARGKIVFTQSDGLDWNLAAINPDGSGKVSLVSDPNFLELAGELSHDGKKLVFISSPRLSPTGGGKQTLKIVDLDTLAVQSLTTDDTFKNHPRFSPDGKKIVFEGDYSTSNSNIAIFLINTDGTGLKRISLAENKHYYTPTISPDGTKIAFKRDNDIYIMNQDGTGETKLTSGGVSGNPHFSVDGAKLLYSYTGGTYTMNVDGTGVTKLGSYDAHDWSPDGTKALINKGSGKFSVINKDGTGETALPLEGIEASW